jgi:1,4-dihydroxy-2-naphthoate octaprenyltransferase
MTLTTIHPPGARLAWAQLLRLPNLVTAVADVAAGISLAYGTLPGWGAVAALLTASVSLYAGGIVLNDAFDVDIDRRERPNRPLASTRIQMQNARYLGLLLLATGVVFAALAGVRSAILAAIIAALAYAYDARLKRHAVVGGLTLAGCRYFNLLMGVAILPFTTSSWLLPMPLALYILAIMPLSRVGLEGDGRCAPVCSGILLVASLVATGGLALAGAFHRPWAALLVALVVGLAAEAVSDAVRAPMPRRLQSTIHRMLIGLIPLNAAVAACGPRPWAGLAILLLLLPARSLGRRIPVT